MALRRMAIEFDMGAVSVQRRDDPADPFDVLDGLTVLEAWPLHA